MPLQPPNYFGLVDPANPLGTDSRTISDDYHRMALASMQQQGPNWDGAITATHEDLNLLSGAVAAGADKALIGVGGTTVVWFYNATVPPGWTLNAPDANLRNLTVAGSGDTGGAIDGTVDPAAATLDVTVDGDNSIALDLPANTDGHALTAAQNGPHTHLELATTGLGSGLTRIALHDTASAVCVDGGCATGSSGSGAAHAHGITGQATGTFSGSTAAFNPRRAVGVLGTLDA